MNANGNAHEHVLGPFGDVSVEFEEVRFLESFEAEVVEIKVAIVDDGSV